MGVHWRKCCTQEIGLKVAGGRSFEGGHSFEGGCTFIGLCYTYESLVSRTTALVD